MTVSVLVPFRDDGTSRTVVWAWLRSWWAATYPDWQVVTGTCPDGPWCKADAVADALTRADGSTLVVADADVLCDAIGAAVDQVAGPGPHRWAVPHRRVNRLSTAATYAVLSGAGLPPPPTTRPRQGGAGWSTFNGESYTGTVGGGLVVVARDLYQLVPLDRRFQGWGQEDAAWGRALSVVAGRPWRGGEPLWHLWHPPQKRMTRAVGSPEGLALYRRYRTTYVPELMIELVAEGSSSARRGSD